MRLRLVCFSLQAETPARAEHPLRDSPSSVTPPNSDRLLILISLVSKAPLGDPQFEDMGPLGDSQFLLEGGKFGLECFDLIRLSLLNLLHFTLGLGQAGSAGSRI